MTDNIDINVTPNVVDITQQVNNVSLSTPGPQGPIGIADPTSSVAYAVVSASSYTSSSAIFSSSSIYSSSAIYSANAVSASQGLISYIDTASYNLINYTNSASLNAYNQASAFTQTASQGLYNFVVSASNGIITAGSVQYSTSAGNAKTSSSAILSSSAIISSSAMLSASSIYASSALFATNAETAVYSASSGMTAQVHAYVKNGASATLYKGQAVYITGAAGANVLIGPAQANGDPTSSKTLGLLEQDLLPNDFGYVATDGLVTGIDTSMAGNEGDPVWLSPTIPGGVIYGTTNKPLAPYHLVYLGVVTRKNQNNGAIFVHVQNGFELDELHNVYAASAKNGDTIVYNTACGLWISSSSVPYSQNSSSALFASSALYAVNSSSLLSASAYISSSAVISSSANISSSAIISASANYSLNSTNLGNQPASYYYPAANITSASVAYATYASTSGPSGGNTNDILVKSSSANYDTRWTKSNLSLQSSSFNNSTLTDSVDLTYTSTPVSRWNYILTVDVNNTAGYYGIDGWGGLNGSYLWIAKDDTLIGSEFDPEIFMRGPYGLGEFRAIYSGDMWNRGRLIIGGIPEGRQTFANKTGVNAPNQSNFGPFYGFPYIPESSLQINTGSAAVNLITGLNYYLNASLPIIFSVSASGDIKANSASLSGNVTVSGSLIAKSSSAVISSSAFISSSTSQTSFSTLSVASAATVGGNLSVTGNLYIGGTSASISASNLVLNDPLLYLADGNPANINDIGIVGSFTPGASNTYQHTGFVRDASDNTWKLFSGVIAEPTNTVDFTSASYDAVRFGPVTASTFAGDGSALSNLSAASLTGAINNISIGSTTRAPGAFTTLRSISTVASGFYATNTVQSSTTSNQVAGVGFLAETIGYNTGATGTVTGRSIFIRTNATDDGLGGAGQSGGIVIDAGGSLPTPVAGMLKITSLTTGTMDNVSIGLTTPVTSKFTSASINNIFVNPSSDTAVTINAAASAKGLVVKANAITPGNLTEWQASDASLNAYMTGLGALYLNDNNAGVASNIGLRVKRQTILDAGQTTITPLVVLGRASQTADLQQWQTSSASPSWVDSAGRFGIRMFGNTAPGAALAVATGSDTTVGAIIRANSSTQSADLQRWQTSTDGSNANSTTVAFISAAGALTLSPSASTALTINGAASAVTMIVQGVSGNDIAQFKPANAFSLNPTVIDQYGRLRVTDTTTSGYQAAITLPSATGIGLRIQGAANHTADLTQWHATGNTILAGVTAGGQIYTGSTLPILVSGSNAQLSVYASSSITAGIVIRGASNQSTDLMQWQNSAGTNVAYMQAAGNFKAQNIATFNSRLQAFEANSGAGILMQRMTSANSAPGSNYGSIYFRDDNTSASTLKLVIRAGATGGETTLLGNIDQTTGSANPYLFVAPQSPSAAVIIQGLSGQTGNLQEWQNSSGNILANITSGGTIAARRGNGIRVYNSADTDYVTLNLTGGLYFTANYRTLIGDTSVTSGAQLTAAPTASTTIGLVVRSASFQSANLQEWQNSAGTRGAYVGANGDQIFTPGLFVTYNAGITSGAAANIPLYIRGIASQTADLTQWQNSSGSVLASVNASGGFTLSSSGTAALQINPTAGTYAIQIKAGDTATEIFRIRNTNDNANLFSISDAGKVSIGNVNTGLSPVPMFGAISNSSTAVVSVIKGTAGQTADLQRWHDSNNNALSTINASGQLVVGSSAALVSTSAAMISVYTTASTIPGIIVKAISNQTVDLQQWQNSSGTVMSRIGFDGIFRGTMSDVTQSGTFLTLPYAISQVPITVKGMAGQTGDLQRWTNSSNNVLSSINASGQFVIGASVALNNVQYSPQPAMLSVVSTSSVTPALVLKSASGAPVAGGVLQEFLKADGTSTGTYVRNDGYIQTDSGIGTKWSWINGYIANVTLAATANNDGAPTSVIKGIAGQTKDLTQWWNSSNVVLSTINASGQFTIGASTTLPSNVASSSAAMLNIVATSSLNPGIIFKTANTAPLISAATPFEIQDVNGSAVFAIAGDGRLWWNTSYNAPGIRWGGTTIYSGGGGNITNLFSALSSSRTALVARGAAGQTYDLMQWQDSNASILSTINASGQLTVGSGQPLVTSSAAMISIYTSSVAGMVGLAIKTSPAGSGDALQTFHTSGFPMSGFGPNGTLHVRTQTTSGALQGFGAALNIATYSDTLSGIIIRGNSGTQVSDLQQFQNSAGTVLSTFNASGQLTIGSAAPLVSTSSAMVSIYNSSSNTPGLIIRGAVNQSPNLQEWQNSNGTVLTQIASNGRFYSTQPVLVNSGGSSFSAQIAIQPAAAGTIGAVIRSQSGQSANLQEWQLSGGASVVAIDPLGNITASGNVVYNQATNAQTSASYTLVLSDAGKFVERNNAGLNYVIVPSNANAAFATGARIDIIQTGAGNTVFSASTGVTLNFYSPTSATSASMGGQWAGVTLIKRATDTWAAIGNIK